MITEQLISFETAKLAKERGFDEFVHTCHCINNVGEKTESYSIGTFNFNNENKDEYGLIHYSAPTQSLLQTWLRKTQNIDACMQINMNNEYSCHIYKNRHSINKGNDDVRTFIVPNGNDYELVLEEGLQEALKLIK